MEFDFSTLQPKERASFALRALYEAAGCRKYHMGRFEEYSLYQANRSFLSSEQVITFTDLDGRLLALKPDVTLSIAKTAQPAPGETLRYYYHENVYRPSAESHTFQEIGQMGLEFLGGVGEAEVQQAVCLAAQSLGQLGTDWVLEVSHMGYLFGLLDALQVPEDARAGLLRKLGQKNAHELRAAALAAGLDEDAADTLCRVLTLCGGYADTLPRAEALCRNDAMRAAVAELQGLAGPLEQAGGAIRLDLTLAGEMEYYNGLVFQGYLKALPRPLLKGGRYDLLMQQFTPGAGAIGFAVYLDELDRLSAPLPPVQKNSTDKVMLNVALPKGRLGDKVYNLLAGIGYGCPEDYNATRKLVVENPAAGIRYFLVKPSDVAIYVEHGAADVGIVGKDILTEAEADVYELLDTGLGKCRMCVAAPADYQDDPSRPVRVATKFVNRPGSPFVRHMGWRGMMSSPDTDVLDFVEEAADGVEEKNGYSAVCQRINDYFHENGVDRVYIAGLDSDCCVLKNAADFFDLGYDVTVLMYYTASNGGEDSVKAARTVLSRMIGEDHVVDGRLDAD